MTSGRLIEANPAPVILPGRAAEPPVARRMQALHRASRRLRRVPWRHVWIVGLAALLLILALFGLFPQH
jgi:type VI protein secretion system component VasF